MEKPDETHAINPNGRNPLERFLNCVNDVVEKPVTWFRGEYNLNVS